jgi:D-sedoheptulose 7-phosphate isomerase
MNRTSGKAAKGKQVPSQRSAASKRGGSIVSPIDVAEQSATELGAVVRKFLETRGSILKASAEAVAARLRAGGKVLIFGNGGSAAEAQHFAAELVNGLTRRDSPPLPAIALTADTCCLTAIGNDRGIERLFSRQIEALGAPGDVAVALTTSGRSPNIVKALRSARAKGLATVGLTGDGGGQIAPLVDFLLDVPSCSTPRIQEAHLFLLHLLAMHLEEDADR